MKNQTGLSDRRRDYAAALDHALEQAVEQLRTDPTVRKVILFGSAARGRRDLCTDLDLIVVLDSAQAFVPRCAELRERLELGVDADLFVYTSKEFERNQKTGFLRRAIEEGRVLYEKNA